MPLDFASETFFASQKWVEIFKNGWNFYFNEIFKLSGLLKAA